MYGSSGVFHAGLKWPEFLVPQWIGENDCETTPPFTPLFLDPLFPFTGSYKMVFHPPRVLPPS